MLPRAGVRSPRRALADSQPRRARGSPRAPAGLPCLAPSFFGHLTPYSSGRVSARAGQSVHKWRIQFGPDQSGFVFTASLLRETVVANKLGAAGVSEGLWML